MFNIQIPIVWPTNIWNGLLGWPQTSPAYTEISQMKHWCNERVGHNNWNYYGIHKKTPCMFKFKKEEDLLAFKLRFNLLS
jgi:hypothetical protein